MYTSSTDRLISTWPYFPHTINYLKTGNFNNKQVLGVCSDDGTLFIWYTETIINLVKNLETQRNRRVMTMIKRLKIQWQQSRYLLQRHHQWQHLPLLNRILESKQRLHYGV